MKIFSLFISNLNSRLLGSSSNQENESLKSSEHGSAPAHVDEKFKFFVLQNSPFNSQD